MALFGEKYGDEVRVVSMGTDDGRYSVELCGGTHVGSLAEIGLFKIVGEGAVASGVRRIEALTGEAARAYLNGRDATLREAATILKVTPEDVPARIASLVEERRRLERELATARKTMASGGAAAAAEMIAGVGFIGQVLEGVDAKALRGLVDDAKGRVGSGVVVLVTVADGRASVATGVTEDLQSRYDAVDLVKRAVTALGGQGGGGRPGTAQGGGPNGDAAPQAISAVRDAVASGADA